jgi:hypothetical protein
MADDPDSLGPLMGDLETYLNAHPEQPWCVHEMFEKVGLKHMREDGLVDTQRALNHLARSGRAGTSGMIVERSEGVCDDWFYWSTRAGHTHLEQFGKPWQFPALSERIQAHCRHRV